MRRTRFWSFATIPVALVSIVVAITAMTPTATAGHRLKSACSSPPVILDFAFVGFHGDMQNPTNESYVEFRATFDPNGGGNGSFGFALDGREDQLVGGGWGPQQTEPITYANSGFQLIHFRSLTPGSKHSATFVALDECGTARSKAVSFTMPGTAPPTPSPPSTCVGHTVIDTRGSGDSLRLSKPARAFVNEFLQFHPKTQVVLNPYPAVGMGKFAGAALRLPAGYHRSVVTGKTWLRTKLKALQTICGTTTKVILIGYSQGAQVAGEVLQEPGLPSNVVGAVFFGDPKFNSADSIADRSNYILGRNGILGTRKIYGSHKSDRLRGRVLSFCHHLDPICQGIDFGNLAHPFSQHTNYDFRGEPERAAQYMATF